MLRITLVLVSALLLLAPTAQAAPEVTRDLKGCADALVNGGSYHGNTLQCEGAGINRDLVDEIMGCVHVTLYGGTMYGNYIQCNGIGVLPLILDNPLVKDAVGCATAIAKGGEYYGPYLQCRGP